MSVRTYESDRVSTRAGSAPAPRRPRPRVARGRAFTLIELVIVMAIIAISAAVAVPRYGSSIARFRAESAARRIQADLGYARSAAEAASASRTVVFMPGSSSYGIGLVRHLDHFSGPYTVSLRDEYGATITSTDFGGDTSVLFDGYGRPDSGGFVQIRTGGADWRVTLDGDTGQTSLQRVP